VSGSERPDPGAEAPPRRLCLVGKYPPIQGGVAAQTYCAVQALSARGYEVDVVTNAREAEPELRQLMLSEDEERLLAGAARIHFTSPLTDDAYVPWTNPYASKLLGLTLSAVERSNSEAIVGWYLEPYALVAATAARITGRPAMLIHAGSDLGGLALHDDLAPAYRWSIGSADRILTHPLLIPRLLALGGRVEQFVFPAASRLPPYFRDPASPLDVQRYHSAAIARDLADWAPSPPTVTPALDPELPTIGVYGKVDVAKGSFDLLAALSELASEGVEFNFVAAVGGHRESYGRFLDLVSSDRALGRRTTALPFLPPWRVPELLAACDVACCLERRFPISFHSSSLPAEIATCGVCPVCSHEVIAQRAGDRVHGETCIEVHDPEDHGELTNALRWAITNRSAAREIGRRARSAELEVQGRFSSSSGVAEAIDDWVATAVPRRPIRSA